VEISGGVVEGEVECGDDMVWLLSRDRRSLDILSVKKEAKLSSSEISGVEEGKGITNTAIINEITTSRNHRQGIQLDRSILTK